MRFDTLAAVAFLQPAALANFQVYCGTSCANDQAGCAVSCTFFNHAPTSCDEINNSVNHVQSQDNDASGCDGLACDGCSLGVNNRDWKITRLEINNSQQCTPSQLYWSGLGEDPHFTIYDDVDGSVVEIRDTNNNVIGECFAAQDPKDEHECFTGIASTYYVHAFQCYSELEYLDSPN